MKFMKKLIVGVVVIGSVVLISVGLLTSGVEAYTDGPRNAGAGSNLEGVGTEPWQDPGNITTVGSPYASVILYNKHTVSNYLYGSLYGFAIPPEAAIMGIEVVVNRMASARNPSIGDNEVRLVKGGEVTGENKAVTVPWPVTLGVAVYGDQTDLWGTTWTATDINSPDFGVALSAMRDNNGNNNRSAIVDTIQITVYYSYTTSTGVVCGDGSPVVYGESVLCYATVTGIPGNQTPSGNVDWVSDGNGTFDPNPCDLSGTGEIATCSAVYTPRDVGTGLHLLTAKYAGDLYYAPSSGSQTVDVVPLPVTVSADAQSKTYGSPDPELTYQITSGSLVFDDTFTGSLTREPGELTGEYAIQQGTLALSVNYVLSYVGNLFTITRADPVCEVTGYDVTYDGNPHTATGSCLGVLGEELLGLDLSGTEHTDAGIYTDPWTFTDETGNYNNASGDVQDLIGKADAECTVTGYDVIYDGNPHTATGTCVGVVGEELLGLNLSGTTHTDAGSYTDPWTFIDVTGNYNDTSGTVGDLIDKADADCDVTGYDVTYNGDPHTATGICLGVMGEELLGLDLSGTTHTDAGTYTDLWIYTDQTGNYYDTDGTIPDIISRVDPLCAVTGYTVEYDREVHLAEGTCLGVKGELLSGLDLAETAHTDIGQYPDDPWTFSDMTGNYNDTSGWIDNEITVRMITVTADAQTKHLGQPDPELTYQVTSGSLLSSDAFSGTLERLVGEAIGTYAILQGTLTLPDYYEITYVGADLTITGYLYYWPLVFKYIDEP